MYTQHGHGYCARMLHYVPLSREYGFIVTYIVPCNKIVICITKVSAKVKNEIVKPLYTKLMNYPLYKFFCGSITHYQPPPPAQKKNPEGIHIRYIFYEQVNTLLSLLSLLMNKIKKLYMVMFSE